MGSRREGVPQPHLPSWTEGEDPPPASCHRGPDRTWGQGGHPVFFLRFLRRRATFIQFSFGLSLFHLFIYLFVLDFYFCFFGYFLFVLFLSLFCSYSVFFYHCNVAGCPSAVCPRGGQGGRGRRRRGPGSAAAVGDGPRCAGRPVRWAAAQRQVCRCRGCVLGGDPGTLGGGGPTTQGE